MSITHSLFAASTAVQAAPPDAPVTALATHRNTRSHRIMLEDAIELMALTKMCFFQPKATDKAEAMKERAAELERQKGLIRARVVMDKSKLDPVTGIATEPLVVHVPIVPKAIRAYRADKERGIKRGDILGWSTTTTIQVPQEDGTVWETEATPFIKQKFGLIRRTDDGMWETTGEHFFFVLKPQVKTRTYKDKDGVEQKKQKHNYPKLFPLGACNPNILNNLNDLHVRDGNLDQVIDPIEHDLRKPGTSRTRIWPSCDEPSDADPLQRMIGTDCGPVMLTTYRSRPPCKRADGTWPCYVAAYWEVEDMLVVEILGEDGVVSVESRVFKSEVGYVVDPIALTGLDVNMINPDDVEASFSELRDLPADATNPVWRALAMQEKPEDNLIDRENDDVIFQMTQVEDAINTAAIRIQAMLKSAFEDAIREFLPVPEVSELTNGDDVEAALAMTEGEDGAVTLIREKLGGFDWTRPMHRKVRRWVIERSVGRAAAPEQKKVEKSAKAAPKAEGGSTLKVPYKGKVNGAKPDVNCVTLLQLSGSTPEELFLAASAVQYTDRGAEVMATVLNEALAAVGSTNFFNASDEGDKKKLAAVFVKARDTAINWAKERVKKT